MVGKSYEERISNERDEAINELQSQLTAQAAHIALLREALKDIAEDGWIYCGPEGPSDAQLKVIAALAIQSDDAALREQNARLLLGIAENVTLIFKELDPDERYYVREMLQRRAAELRSGK